MGAFSTTFSVTIRLKPAWMAPATCARLSALAMPLPRQARFTPVRLWKATPLFTPWIYVALALICLPLAFRQRDLLAWYTSGIIMESSLLVLAPSRDFRYSHWLIITTVVATIILTARRVRPVQPQASEPPARRN